MTDSYDSYAPSYRDDRRDRRSISRDRDRRYRSPSPRRRNSRSPSSRRPRSPSPRRGIDSYTPAGAYVRRRHSRSPPPTLRGDTYVPSSVGGAGGGGGSGGGGSWRPGDRSPLPRRRRSRSPGIFGRSGGGGRSRSPVGGRRRYGSRSRSPIRRLRSRSPLPPRRVRSPRMRSRSPLSRRYRSPSPQKPNTRSPIRGGVRRDSSRSPERVTAASSTVVGKGTSSAYVKSPEKPTSESSKPGVPNVDERRGTSHHPNRRSQSPRSSRVGLASKPLSLAIQTPTSSRPRSPFSKPTTRRPSPERATLRSSRPDSSPRRRSPPRSPPPRRRSRTPPLHTSSSSRQDPRDAPRRDSPLRGSIVRDTLRRDSPPRGPNSRDVQSSYSSTARRDSPPHGPRATRSPLRSSYGHTRDRTPPSGPRSPAIRASRDVNGIRAQSPPSRPRSPPRGPAADRRRPPSPIRRPRSRSPMEIDKKEPPAAVKETPSRPIQDFRSRDGVQPNSPIVPSPSIPTGPRAGISVPTTPSRPSSEVPFAPPTAPKSMIPTGPRAGSHHSSFRPGYHPSSNMHMNAGNSGSSGSPLLPSRHHQPPLAPPTLVVGPPIVQGGKLLPPINPEISERLQRLKTDQAKIEEECRSVQEKKRKLLREWDRGERDLASARFRADLAEQQLKEIEGV